ncbi:hypothetical protein YC2023_029067 [Brassica napus]
MCSFLTMSLWTEVPCTKLDVCSMPSTSLSASQCSSGRLKHIVLMGEKPSDEWDLSRVAVDALGAAMLVTIILDLWRLFLGPIVPLPEGQNCLQSGLPWFSR